MDEYSKEEYQAIEQADRNAIFDTCIFDSIVEGYLIAVMQDLEKTQQETAEALEHLQMIFTELGANEVLAIRDGFINN